jgi:hypothetical protein
MKLTTLSAAVAAMFVFAQSAQAAEHHRHQISRHHFAHRQAGSRYYANSSQGQSPYAAQDEFSGGGFNVPGQPSNSAQHGGFLGAALGRALGSALGGRPAEWCGWEMRQLVSSDPGPAFNLARNWARWGQPGPVGVGAVVVWSHHVGKVVGRQNGTWVVESGNDGHAVRTRPRSLAGVIAVRWG